MGAPTQEMLKKYKIHHYTTFSIYKAAHVERFNRTIMEKIEKYMYAKNTMRYLNVLQDIVEAYNNTRHRIIGMAPYQVSKSNENDLLLAQYSSELPRRRPKFKIGDLVRFQHQKFLFEKGRTQKWSPRLYRITHILHKFNPIMYKIVDNETNEEVKGSFNPAELELVYESKYEYNIERVLDVDTRTILDQNGGKKKVRFYLIQWLDKPDSFRSWLSEDDIAPNLRKDLAQRNSSWLKREAKKLGYEVE